MVTDGGAGQRATGTDVRVATECDLGADHGPGTDDRTEPAGGMADHGRMVQAVRLIAGEVPGGTLVRVCDCDQVVNVARQRQAALWVVVVHGGDDTGGFHDVGEVPAVAPVAEDVDGHTRHPGEPMPPSTPMCSHRGASPCAPQNPNDQPSADRRCVTWVSVPAFVAMLEW